MGFYIADKPKEKDISKEYSYQQLWEELVLDKQYTAKDRVAVYDGDYIAYTLSAVSDQRVIDVTRGGKTKQFNTRTEFKEYCKNNYLDYDTFIITDRLIPEDVSYCLGTLKRFMKNVKEKTNTNKSIILLGGSNNQRCEVLLEKKYKDNRKDLIKPTHLQAVREYLINYCGAKVITDYESDDLVVSITCHIKNNTEADAIAISVDKDARQALTPFSYYNPQKDETYHLRGGLGDLQYNKKLTGYGLKWLIAQVFLFDRSDNYSMNSYYIKQFGEKSFYDTFKDCDNEHNFLQAVVDKWKELLPQDIEYVAWNGEQQKDNWLSLAEKHFELAYMRGYQDNTTFKSLLDKYGVEYD